MNSIRFEQKMVDPINIKPIDVILGDETKKLIEKNMIGVKVCDISVEYIPIECSENDQGVLDIVQNIWICNGIH